MVRYNANGSLDTLGFNPAGTFGIAPNSPGKVVTSVQAGSDYGNVLVLQPDGMILVGGATWNGTDWDWVVLRLMPELLSVYHLLGDPATALR